MSGSMEQRITEAAELHRPYGLDCKCGRPINSDADWAAHFAKVVGPRRIDTVEELAALAHMALIRTPDGDIWERRGRIGRWDNLSTDGSGGLTYSRDVPIGDGALLLWTPDA